MLVVNRSISIPLDEFTITFSRSGGPGGQNVNKVATKATLRWPVETSPHLPEDVRERFRQRFHRRITKEGELVITSQRYRDSARNASDCLRKLREMIQAVAEPPKVRRRTRPTRASKESRLREKKRVARRKVERRKPGLDD